MEAAHSSRSSSDVIEYDPKVEFVGTSAAADPSTGGVSGANVDAAMAVRRKSHASGLEEMRVPQFRFSGCSDGEDTDSEVDLCSDSDDEDGECYNPFASGVVPPVLPDIQLRVPMEDANDAQRVKDALLIKGVLDVVCDEERQLVTVTGIVPPMRLLKKVRRVKREATVVSTSSPFSHFVNPATRMSTQFAFHEDRQESQPIAIPSANSAVPNFVVLQERPRPTFQRYNFHNDPHSPFLRTFSPSDLSPLSGEQCCRSFFDDEFDQGSGFLFA